MQQLVLLFNRAAQLKARESKVQRHLQEIKERESKAINKESMLHRRVQDIEYRERILEGKTAGEHSKV